MGKALLCFFFIKQKTAYEMRISDWSSDVCSSDLLGEPEGAATPEESRVRHPQRSGRAISRCGSFSLSAAATSSEMSSARAANRIWLLSTTRLKPSCLDRKSVV